MNRGHLLSIILINVEQNMKKTYGTAIISKVIFQVLIILFVSGTVIRLGYASPISAPSFQTSNLTPLQQGIMSTFKERAKSGISIPEIDYQSELSSSLSSGSITNAELIIMTSMTIINFAGPEQAGFDKWPPLIVPNEFVIDSQGQLGEVVGVDRTEEFQALIEQHAPNVLNQYEFGHEPRTLRITERLVFTPASSLFSPLASGGISTNENILMGFTYTVPTLEYMWGFSFCVFLVPCVDVGMGYELDGALGLRLPLQATLSGPSQISEWENYFLTAQIKPLNWAAHQYGNAGVAIEDGNEFVARFVGRIYANVTFGGVTLGIDYNCQTHHFCFNLGRSFATPFGPGTRFPIPRISNIPLGSIPVFDIIKVNIGVGLNFILTSTNITADWNVVTPDNAVGQGQITFTNPSKAVSLGPILVNDMPPNDVKVELSNFRYWFNRFEVEIFLNASVSIELPLFGTIFTSPTYSTPPFLIDLSPIIGGLGLSVGGYIECSFDYSCLRLGPDNVLQLTSMINNINAAPVRNYSTSDTKTLTWNRITWATNYQVQIANNLTFSNPSTYDVGIVLEYTTPSLTIGRYYWRVRAQRLNGTWGTWSPSDSFIIDLD